MQCWPFLFLINQKTKWIVCSCCCEFFCFLCSLFVCWDHLQPMRFPLTYSNDHFLNWINKCFVIIAWHVLIYSYHIYIYFLLMFLYLYLVEVLVSFVSRSYLVIFLHLLQRVFNIILYVFSQLSIHSIRTFFYSASLSSGFVWLNEVFGAFDDLFTLCRDLCSFLCVCDFGFVRST